MGAATLKVPTIFTAVDKVSSIFDAMGKKARTFNDKLKNIGNVAAVAGSAILGGFGVMAVDAVMDYEVALHSLEAVTGSSSALFKGQIEDIANRTHKSAIDVAGSFEVIGSAMSQYLSDPKALGQITDAGITLAKASRQDLEPTLQNLTSIMNQFDLSADKANDTINRLTAGEIVGQVTTANMAGALQQFGAIANANNVHLDESVALVEVLGKKLPTEQLGTASRNLITFMSAAAAMPKPAIKAMAAHGVSTKLLMDKNVSLGVKLKELSKIKGDAIAMEAFFGRENMASGTIILNNLKTYDDWQRKILVTNEAQRQAAVNSDTLANALSEIKNQFINNIVSGKKLSPALEKVKDAAFWVANNMDLVITSGITLIGVLYGIKAISMLVATVTFLSSAAMGVYTFVTDGSTVALEANTVAQGAYKIATALTAAYIWAASTATSAWNVISKASVIATYAWTAAQWLLNAALTANPIGLIIVGIAALIALVVAIIAYWDEWGSVVAIFMGPLGLVISMIQSFRRNWDMVKKAFSEGGILEGLKAVGRVLLDAVLQPVQSLLEMLAKIPGLSDLATSGANKIKEIRQSLDVNMEGNNPKKEILSSPQQTQQAKNAFNGKMDINLNDPSGAVKDYNTSSGGVAIPIRVTPTQGQ